MILTLPLRDLQRLPAQLRGREPAAGLAGRTAPRGVEARADGPLDAGRDVDDHDLVGAVKATRSPAGAIAGVVSVSLVVRSLTRPPVSAGVESDPALVAADTEFAGSMAAAMSWPSAEPSGNDSTPRGSLTSTGPHALDVPVSASVPTTQTWLGSAPPAGKAPMDVGPRTRARRRTRTHRPRRARRSPPRAGTCSSRRRRRCRSAPARSTGTAEPSRRDDGIDADPLGVDDGRGATRGRGRDQVAARLHPGHRRAVGRDARSRRRERAASAPRRRRRGRRGRPPRRTGSRARSPRRRRPGTTAGWRDPSAAVAGGPVSRPSATTRAAGTPAGTAAPEHAGILAGQPVAARRHPRSSRLDRH